MSRNFILYTILILSSGTTQCRKGQAPYAASTPIVYNNIDSPKTFLALGDSYTIGQSVTTTERFPAQTTALLRSAGINITDPKYIAATGWTTDILASAINNQQPLGTFSVVSLLIGVNDQYQRHDTTGYRQRFRDLLNTSILLAGNKRNHVFVLSIPDYGVTPFGGSSDTGFINRQIDQFNNINREETMQASCQYIDITASTREALSDPTLIASDGLHPSGKEYSKWANRLAPMMSSVLR